MNEAPKRVSYRQAGEAGRQLVRAANHAEPPLRGSALRVVAALVALIPLYSRTKDQLSVAQVADFAALHPKTTGRILRNLGARSDIPLRYTARTGPGATATIELGIASSSQLSEELGTPRDSQLERNWESNDEQLETVGNGIGNRATAESVYTEKVREENLSEKSVEMVIEGVRATLAPDFETSDLDAALIQLRDGINDNRVSSPTSWTRAVAMSERDKRLQAEREKEKCPHGSPIHGHYPCAACYTERLDSLGSDPPANPGVDAREEAS